MGWASLLQPDFFNPILVSLLLLSMLFLLRFRRRNCLNLPPSPPTLPLLGNLHQIDRLLHRSLKSLSVKYGPVMRVHLSNLPIVVVSSGDAAKDLARQEAFADRPLTVASNILFCNNTDVTFCPYGEYWRRAKKICVFELLSQKRVKNFQFVREEEASRMIEKIRTLQGKVINLRDILEDLSSSIVSRCALGKLYGRNDGKKSFGELSRSAMDITGSFCFGDLFPALGWLDIFTGYIHNLKAISNELHSFLDQVIEEHRELRKADEESDAKDFVDILLGHQNDGIADAPLTQQNIRAILLDMFIGGTDTTAATIEWAMAELVKNPRTLKKAQEEVRRVVGMKPEIDEADINDMIYLKCVVKESLRLHPAAPVIGRRAVSDAKLQGYDIPEKTVVVINAFAVHRDPKVWERPDEFYPERLLEIHADSKEKEKELIAFGSGRRSCPGSLFAIAEAEYALANLLYWFNWELPNGETVETMDMMDIFGVVVRKKVPLRLVLTNLFLLEGSTKDTEVIGGKVIHVM